MPSLTTVAQVKDYLVGIAESIPEGHDDLVDFIVKAVGDSVERFCRRRFTKQTYTAEKYTGGKLQKVIYFNHWPVTVVTTVTIKENDVTTTITEGTNDTQYQKVRNVDQDVVALYREDGWESDALGVSLTYDAGYVLPGVTGRDLPFDLERAAVELVAGAYQSRGRSGVSRESFEGLSLDLDRWPQHVVMTLRKYQRPVI